ncbi:hypothetical protein [Myroides sp. LJL110]
MEKKQIMKIGKILCCTAIALTAIAVLVNKKCCDTQTNLQQGKET